ncbi:hypothetical protein NVV95_13130 [Herbiconiux sp. CPCC 205716]|uniref:Uncharacterized protein n=1 Tax=Herbiconiux gentiana TaxID=2970912 RepID=A0ABT2GIR5_9MICO|nr:DUF6578 domain-containing protein [Herbiconiux gentiana]MCS5715487.1 hypothetical protein [Herbiconiux gentiana]
MLIEVAVPGWEHACCGEAFAVGAPRTFSLLAAPPVSGGPTPFTGGPTPFTGKPTPLPRYREEHHGQTPADVPQWEVTGLVVAIEAVEYGSRERPGRPGVHEWSEEGRRAHPLDTVAARASGPGEYLVTLEVDETVALPGYRLSVEESEHERLRLEAVARADERAVDAVGVRLSRLADDLERRWRGHGSVGRSANGANLSFRPHGPGAILAWSRSDAPSDGVAVQLGDGRFGLGADDDGVRMLEAFVEAASAGRVQERVRETVDGVEFATEVVGERGADDVLERATRTAQVLRSGTMVAMAGPVRERIERGDHRWAPWGE